MTKKIAISMGDPGGIGPEIIIKSLSSLRDEKISWVVVGSRVVFEASLAASKKSIPFSFIQKNQLSSFQDTCAFIDVDAEDKVSFQKAAISKNNAMLAMQSLELATELALENKVDAVCTAPINKTSMRLINADFVGHTEYLAQRSKSPVHAMAFFSPKLRVVLSTIHLPLKDVAGALTQDSILEKILLMDEALRRYSSIKEPRIAVCALNPHGRETGTEEDEIIAPAVEKAKSHKVNAVGPLSADQLFYEAYQGHYDAVVSMYHDQGLGPFKMISFHDGVNVTLGLPFIRTSPDHGTAFDIAFQDKADPRSMTSAMQLAAEFVKADAQ